MRWTSTLSKTANTAEAVREVVRTVRSALVHTPDLVVVFASPHHEAGYRLLTRALSRAFPHAVILGGSGHGIIGGGREIEDGPALSVTAAWLPDVRLDAFHVAPHSLPDANAHGGIWADLLGLGAESPQAFLLVADPFTPSANELVESLDVVYPSTPKIGGVASGGDGPRTTALFLGDRVLREGTVGVALTGNIEVDTVVSQGCKPIGPPMIVTRSEANLILELDGRAPLEALQEIYDALEEPDKVLFRTSLSCGIELRDTVLHRDDAYLVRPVLGLHEETDGLYIDEVLRPWQVIRFHLRDPRASDADLRRMLARYRKSRNERLPLGALLFSCVWRGRDLYGYDGHDSAVFREVVGDVPLGGFFCSGEIGPSQGSTYLHGYTSAFGLFRPRGGEV